VAHASRTRTASLLSAPMAKIIKPDPILPMPPIAGPRSIAHRIQPAWRVVKNMTRLRNDELCSHTGIAALRNLMDDTLPELQQKALDAGAIEAIIAAMQAHPNCAGIQVAGSGTLVIAAAIDSAARKRACEAGAILEINNDGDGEKFGKHIVHKANFARDCLLKVAGKATDPRNKKHIQAALDAGVDPALFKRKDEKTRNAEAEAAHEVWLSAKEAEKEADSKMSAQKPWVGIPENVREVAALFPGQGTQKVGMANKLLEDSTAKALFTVASKILGYNLVELLKNGPQDKLDQTLYSQPAIFVTSLAAMEKAKKEKKDMLMKMKSAAGFSLGEYSALVFGGAMTFEEGLRVVKARAEAMDVAAKEAASGMASVSGMADDALQKIIDESEAAVGGGKKGYIANYMFPEGRTCSGDVDVLKKMCEKINGIQGKNAKMLNVSGAFHTPYMAAASASLAAVLDQADIAMPSIAVYSNVTGKPYESVDEIKTLLKRQLLEPVKWEQGTKYLIEQGHAAFIEPGPGKQLKAMMRRIDQPSWGKMITLDRASSVA